MNRKLLSRATKIAPSLVALISLPAFAAPTTGAIEEVVVTAQRREEKLQNVPISVTALSAETLKLNDVRDITRIEILTPGFTFGRSGSDARPAIRGVRTENVAVSGDPTIGFYVDGIYQTRASQALQPFVDVARVEVERGPQGTLFGRNTFGGAVSVVNAAPSDKFEGGATFTYGEFSRVAGDGYVNVPVTDKIQLRFAALRETMDGYVKALVPGVKDAYNRDTTYARGSAHFQLTEALDATVRYSYWTEKGTGAGAFGYRVGGVFVNPTTGKYDLIGGVPTLANPKQKSGAPTDVFVGGIDQGFPIIGGPLDYPGDIQLVQDLKQTAVSGQINYDFGPVVARSITGYIDFRVFRNADNDFSPRLFNVDQQDDALTSWTEELQLASAKGNRLEWLVGYFYLNEDISKSIFSSLPETTYTGANQSNAWPKTTSNAGYAQASYFVLPDKLRLTAGIRYTDDKKDVYRYISNFVSGAHTETFAGQKSFDFTRTTWRANADYFVAADNMLYGSVSTGFRSGGFNSGSFTNPAIPGSFSPETVTAYELGSKNRFLEGRLQVNAALFRNEFKNLQVQNQFLVPAAGGGFTTTSAILNAASAHAQGIEAELLTVPVANLRLSVTGTITDAKYDSYANVPAPALYSGTYNLSGNKVPYTPKYKLTFNASYEYSLGTNGSLTPQVTVVASGGYFNTDFNTVLDHQKDFTKTDLRLSWQSASEKYRGEVFVDNVGNTVTLNRATFGSGGLNESFSAPRMWGMRVGVNF